MSTYKIPGFIFGPFFLDTVGRRLLRDGKRVRLGPMEIKLLEILIKNRGKVIKSDELRIRVWGKAPNRKEPIYQDKNALYVSLTKLRKALKEHRSWIVNVSKAGYTFSDEIEVKEIIGTTNNLPHPLTSFVGREEAISEIQNVLKEVRLLTLSGPPGIGKTRLAVHIATAISANYQHGVYLIDLVPVLEEAMVPKAVASELGVPEKPDRPIIKLLSDFLKDKNSLLILDNCERVIVACAALTEELLSACGDLQILVTSREALEIIGEAVWIVSPLSIPELGQTPTISEITSYEAAELFIERAHLRDPKFKINKRNVSAVAELCRQLEGIPLAIELVAAHMGEKSVEQILSLLTEQFELIKMRGGRVSSRHQTLEDAINWSYELLPKDEQLLLRRLSVFVGGFTLEAAEGVCSGEGIKMKNTLSLLTRLVRKSLVIVDEKNDEMRYRMLEIIRQYSRRRLQESGEESRLLSIHSNWFLKLAEQTQAAATGSEKGEGLKRLQTEHDNLRAVLRRNIHTEGNLEIGLRLCGALRRFWLTRGHISEARRWTEKAIELDTGVSQVARARALQAAGSFFGQFPNSEDDPERGRAFFEESLALWQKLGNKEELARTLTDFSYLLDRQGDFDRAEDAAQEGLNIFKELGNPIGIASAYHNWALAVLDGGDYERAVPLFEQSLQTARKTGDKLLPAICLHNLGEIALHRNELDKASSLLEESLALSQELGHMPLSARTEVMLGEIANRRGNYTGALALQRRSLETLQEIGDTQGIAYALEAIACTEAIHGSPRHALQLYGGATELRESSKLFMGPFQQLFINRCLEEAQQNLGGEAAKRALAEGRKTALEEVIRLAIGGVG